MSEVIRRPGFTIVDGVEHPDAVYRCTQCGAGATSPAFTLPVSWCVLKIEVGMPDGISLDDKKLLCPRCARAFLHGALSGGDAAPEVPALPAPRRVRRSSR